MAKSSLHRWTIQEAMAIKTGAGGVDFMVAEAPASGSDPANHTSNGTRDYVAITALTSACVVTTLSMDTDIWDAFTNLSLPQGVTIYGYWSMVKLSNSDHTSGTQRLRVHRAYSTD